MGKIQIYRRTTQERDKVTDTNHQSAYNYHSQCTMDEHSLLNQTWSVNVQKDTIIWSTLAPKSILNSDTGINLTQTAATGFEKTHMQNDSQSEVNSLISNRFDLNAPRCIFSNFCRFNDLQRRETPGKRQQLQNHSQITCQQEELWTWSNPIHSPQGAIAQLHNQNRNLVQLNVQHLQFS